MTSSSTSLCGVDALCGGRLIAGIGTGDKLSREENEAYGIPFELADIRRERLASVATAVAGCGIPVWIGGGRPEMVALARADRGGDQRLAGGRRPRSAHWSPKGSR